MDPRAQVLKDEGNAAFEAGRNEDAVRLYTSALDFGANAVLYSNRAAAYLKLAKYDKALEDASSAIRVDPSYVKAYARKGNALMALGKLDEARKAFKEGLSVDASSTLLREKLRELDRCNSAAGAASRPTASSAERRRSKAVQKEAVAPTFQISKPHADVVTAFGLECSQELKLVTGPGFADCRPEPRPARESVLMDPSTFFMLRGEANCIGFLERLIMVFWSTVSKHDNTLHLTREAFKNLSSLEALCSIIVDGCFSSPAVRAALTGGSLIMALSIASAFTTDPHPKREAKLIELLDCFGDYVGTGPLAVPDPWGVRDSCLPRSAMCMALNHATPDLLTLLVSKGVPLNPRLGRSDEPPLWDAYKVGRADIFQRLMELGAKADAATAHVCAEGTSWCTCFRPKTLVYCGKCPSKRCSPQVELARLGMLRSLLTRQPELLTAEETCGDVTLPLLGFALRKGNAASAQLVLDLGAPLDCASKHNSLSQAILSGVPEVVELLVNKYKLAENNSQYSDVALREIAESLSIAAIAAYPPANGAKPWHSADPSGLSRSVDIVLNSGLKASWNHNRQNSLLARLSPTSAGPVIAETHAIELLERFRRAGWLIAWVDEDDFLREDSSSSGDLAVWAYCVGLRAVAEYAVAKGVCGVDNTALGQNGARYTLLTSALNNRDTSFAERLLTVHKAKAAYPGSVPFMEQPLFALLQSSRLDDAAAERLLRLMIANTPDLLEMDCCRERGALGTGTATVEWTPIISGVSPPHPLCLELLLRTVPVAKEMACQPITTNDEEGRFVCDTPLLVAVQWSSWKCAALLLAHTNALVTERLPGGYSSSGERRFRPSPLDAIREAAAGPNPPPRELIVAFEDAARREKEKVGSVTSAQSTIDGRGVGATTNAFEDPSLGGGSGRKAKKGGKKHKSGKKKGRGRKKKAQAGAGAMAVAAAESSDDDSSGGEDDDAASEEPDDNLVDSRYAPSLDVMLAERARARGGDS